MNKPSLAAVSLTLLAVTALAASGCGPAKSADNSAGSTSASPSPSPSVAPKDALVKAMKALNLTAEKFSATSNGKVVGSGIADVPHSAGDLSAKSTENGVSISLEQLTVGNEVFVKYDFGTKLNKQLKLDPKKWLKLDLSKVTDKSTLAINPADPDPLSLEAASSALADVVTTDGLTYTGTIDLDAAGNSILVVGDNLVSKYGDKIKAVPFTAMVNSAGQLTAFKVDGTGIGTDVSADVEFSDFGQAAVVRPTSFANAPAALYQILNSNG